MGNNEAETPSKSEKASSPTQEQANIHPYPDWAAIQAYYGPGVTLPPPYFNSAVTSGHAPHPYMWAPHQTMMPPYGVPYAAIYSHGGVYAHPAVPLVKQYDETCIMEDGRKKLIFLAHDAHEEKLDLTIVPVMQVATPLSIETPAKSSGNKDQGLMKKLKGFNGFSVSIGNGNSESAAGGSVGGLSQRFAYLHHSSHLLIPFSGSKLGGELSSSLTVDMVHNLKLYSIHAECGTEGSSDGSDGNTAGAYKTRRKRVCGGTPSIGKDGKVDTEASLIPGGEVNAASSMSLGVGKSVGTVITPSMTTALELSCSPNGKAKTAACVPPIVGAVVPPEAWVQDERELKRQRRKQSNRESARRSRLRKQAESEELAIKVETLNAENMTLRSEINQLAENSEKLRLENAALMEKLKNAQLGQVGEMDSDKFEAEMDPPISTENFLSRVNNNSDSVGRNVQHQSENLENSKSGTKLHQLLESSPRADPVAAG
ncbi:hypothetical protein HHK36_027580 [Tetracentron sinense]|uniref:BZIP domain-containing protein n=1 Tax=Tetracentron sinense TaxID=13715 RepID=A0A834YI26_TETSI|nr:hypothetical protein HHK36_027580 [Tetracentron sinense]